jgi:hypothetical protein
MDTVLSLLISAGIIAFGIWIVVSTITAGWGWTLPGLWFDLSGTVGDFPAVKPTNQIDVGNNGAVRCASGQ